MGGEKDYYEILGVPRNTTPEQLRKAYRDAALLLHPDRNVNPGDTEKFLDIGKAYETLIDPASRAEYDKELAQLEAELAEKAPFVCDVQSSRASLLQLGEPQVHYLLLSIRSAPHLPATRAPINLCLVIDRSTSMQGPRLDQIRSAALSILQGLKPHDTASIVSFSDNAELVITPEQASNYSVARARLSLLQAGGGTEIGQGLKLGLHQLRESLIPDGVNHLVLLTDGRTYGDEELCMQLADLAASQGVTIIGIGIGSDWNDRLLDEMTSRTGGNVLFLDTPRAVAEFLHRIFESLSRVFASRMRLEGSFAQQVDLRSAFRIIPEPMPLSDALPINLGNLGRDGEIQVIMELVIHPIGQMAELELGHLMISGDVLGMAGESQSLPVRITCKVSDHPDPSPPPPELLSSLGYIVLYRMQEKARHEAETGQAAKAARRLESLATQLMASGERDLAKAALSEAARVSHTRRLSTEGEKVLKYGTRSLLLPGRTEET